MSLQGITGIWVMLTIAASGFSTAHAQSRFDGTWRIRFGTDQTPGCTAPPTYVYLIKIDDGSIMKLRSDATRRFTGTVDAQGVVSADADLGGTHRARGTGRLQSDAGRGNWNATTMPCTGVWTARRVSR